MRWPSKLDRRWVPHGTYGRFETFASVWNFRVNRETMDAMAALQSNAPKLYYQTVTDNTYDSFRETSGYSTVLCLDLFRELRRNHSLIP